MILDDGDRAKFCAYVRVQVETAEAIIRQLTITNAPKILIEREKLRQLGYKIVLDDLEAIECQSVSILPS